MPPEALAAIVGLKAMAWLLVGFRKLKIARQKSKEQEEEYGMITSVRASGDVYLATVEYSSRSGRKKRLLWRCDSEPLLGQSVRLRASRTDLDEMEVAESGDTVKGAAFCIVVGSALVIPTIFLLL